MSVQMCCPEGANAACVKVIPMPSATICAVAAVPKNWQPPPGLAQALHPRSAASCNDISPWEKRAPIVWILPASSPSLGGNVTPPGMINPGSSDTPAIAINIAGKPLSQVAMPITPLRVGNDLI